MGCLTIGLFLAIFATTSVLCTPTVFPAKNFNAAVDAKFLHDILEEPSRAWTDIPRCLVRRSLKQRLLINDEFLNMFNESLVSAIEFNYGNGWYGKTLIAMLKPLAKLYLDQMESVLPSDVWGYLDIIVPIADELLELEGVKNVTHEMKNFIGSELNDERQFILDLINSNGAGKSILSSTGELVSHTVENAKKLLVETNWADTFVGILKSEGYAELKLLYDEYKKYSKVGLYALMESHLSSEYYKKYKDILIRATNKPLYFAIKLHDAMNGLGTNESALLRIIVGRSEIDLVEIIDAYKVHYETSLAGDIKGDTSDSFRDLLLVLIGATQKSLHGFPHGS